MKFNLRMIPGILTLAFLLFVIACSEDESTKIPNVSDIEADYELKRFDQAIYEADTVQWDSSWVDLRNEYPVFYKLFLSQVLQVADEQAGDSTLSGEMKAFATADPVRGLMDTVQTLYGDFSGIEQDFQQAFRYYRYYFPDKEIPDVYTFVSEFTLATFIFEGPEQEDDLAVGLDFFLGDAFSYERINIQGGAFSSYLTRTFNRDHLVKKTLDALINDLTGPVPRSNLLHQMIHYGKRIYISDQLLPQVSDTVIMEYKPEQLDWCRNNEQNVWSYFLSNDLLYSEDWSKTQAYIRPAPHSRGMPREAPGRTAVWLGWQIVEEFMERHPEVSMQELIDLRDAQHILDASKYKPRR